MKNHTLLVLLLYVAMPCCGAGEEDPEGDSSVFSDAVDIKERGDHQLVGETSLLTTRLQVSLSGPLLTCPDEIDHCFEGIPEGNECEAGDLLITTCQTCSLGDCFANRLNIPRPCCHGYWLLYTSDHSCDYKNMEGDRICPLGDSTLISPDCWPNNGMWSSDDCTYQLSTEPGWESYEYPATGFGEAAPCILGWIEQVSGAVYREYVEPGGCGVPEIYNRRLQCDEANNYQSTEEDRELPSDSFPEESWGLKRQIRQCLMDTANLNCQEGQFYCVPAR